VKFKKFDAVAVLGPVEWGGRKLTGAHGIIGHIWPINDRTGQQQYTVGVIGIGTLVFDECQLEHDVLGQMARIE
jgi:hypothetical protein